MYCSRGRVRGFWLGEEKGGEAVGEDGSKGPKEA